MGLSHSVFFLTEPVSALLYSNPFRLRRLSFALGHSDFWFLSHSSSLVRASLMLPRVPLRCTSVPRQRNQNPLIQKFRTSEDQFCFSGLVLLSLAPSDSSVLARRPPPLPSVVEFSHLTLGRFDFSQLQKSPFAAQNITARFYSICSNLQPSLGMIFGPSSAFAPDLGLSLILRFFLCDADRELQLFGSRKSSKRSRRSLRVEIVETQVIAQWRRECRSPLT